MQDLVDSWQQKLDQDADPVLPALTELGYQLYQDENGKPVLEAQGQRQKRNSQGELLYRQPRLPDVSFTASEIKNLGSQLDQYEPLLETYQRPTALKPKAWPASHIAARLRQLDERSTELNQYLDWLNLQLNDLDERLRQHLWLDTDLAHVAQQQLVQQQQLLQQQAARLAQLREKFAELPVEKD